MNEWSEWISIAASMVAVIGFIFVCLRWVKTRHLDYRDEPITLNGLSDEWIEQKIKEGAIPGKISDYFWLDESKLYLLKEATPEYERFFITDKSQRVRKEIVSKKYNETHYFVKRTNPQS